MKNRLNIFSNNNINNFLKKLFCEHELILMKYEDVALNLQSTNPNIIIINDKNDFNLINLDQLNENFLLIYNLKKNNLVFKKNIKFLNTPLSINQIKNTISSFIQNFKVKFHDISIDNEKIKNVKNGSFSYLTKAEVEILKYIIREKEVSKSFIKENILNIKSNIETNSLESHLTRIRKKMNQVKTAVKLQTKSEKLLIMF
tara:strand:- start:58 stop:660 length:603 start_codon:yes stop_codon:yes gene_type:complete